MVIPISLASSTHSVRLSSDEKQSSSHLRELKAKSHNLITVSNSCPSAGGVKLGFEVVKSIVGSWAIVVVRFFGSVLFISSEVLAQETTMAIIEIEIRRFLILIEQFSSIFWFLDQQDLLPANAIAAISAEVANVVSASSVCMKEFL